MFYGEQKVKENVKSKALSYEGYMYVEIGCGNHLKYNIT